jgi:hypothetical protein
MLIIKKAFILMCIFFLAGCGDRPPMSDKEKEAEEKAMLAYLEKKYNRPFVMESMVEVQYSGFGVSDRIEAKWRDNFGNLFNVNRSLDYETSSYNDEYFGIAVKQLMTERYATDIEKIGDEVVFTISASTNGPETINPTSSTSVNNSELEVYADIEVVVDSNYKREDHYVAIQKLLEKLRDEKFYSLVLHINFIPDEHKSKSQAFVAEHYLDALSYSEFSNDKGVELEPYEDSIEFVKGLYR